jgi:transcriptional regulator with XRE-family HTH domain
METAGNGEDCLFVNDHGESTTTRKPADQRDRAAALRQRRLANGIKSVRALHEQSGVSRDAITTAEAGRASEATYQRLEAWFARYELANTAQDVALAQIEYEVHSGDGLRITVRGLLADAEQLERAVTRLIRELRQPG